jgi:uncharacterized protein DUF4396
MEPRLGRTSHGWATGRRPARLSPSRPVRVKHVTVVSTSDRQVDGSDTLGGYQRKGLTMSGWKMAASATLHCLTGCAIGEVLGMVIGTAFGWSDAATVVLAVALAFVFGYALTMRGLLTAGVGVRRALRVALAADTVSITVMEIVDNVVMIGVPGALAAGLGDGLFWGALAFSLAVAFVVTVPVNRWLIARGSGHAVVHEYRH